MSAPRTCGVFAVIFIAFAVVLGNLPVSTPPTAGSDAYVCGSLFSPRNGAGLGIERVLSEGVAPECQTVLLRRAASVFVALSAALVAMSLSLLALAGKRIYLGIADAGGVASYQAQLAHSVRTADDRRTWPALRRPTFDLPDIRLPRIGLPQAVRSLGASGTLRTPSLSAASPRVPPLRAPSLRAPVAAVLLGVLALSLASTVDQTQRTDQTTSSGTTQSPEVVVQRGR